MNITVTKKRIIFSSFLILCTLGSALKWNSNQIAQQENLANTQMAARTEKPSGKGGGNSTTIGGKVKDQMSISSNDLYATITEKVSHLDLDHLERRKGEIEEKLVHGDYPARYGAGKLSLEETTQFALMAYELGMIKMKIDELHHEQS